MMVYRLIVILFVLLFSVVANAQQNFRPALIAIVDVDCSFCRDLVSRGAFLRSIADEAGFDFIYAPIPGDGNIRHAWPEKTYYAVRDEFGTSYSDNMLAILMSSQDLHPLHSQSDVIVWLQTRLPGVDWANFVPQKSPQSNDSLVRAMRLAGVVGISQFPTFAVVGDSGRRPYQIAAGHDAPLAMRIREIESFLNNYAGRGR